MRYLFFFLIFFHLPAPVLYLSGSVAAQGQAEVPRGGGSWAQRLRRETHPSFPSRNILAFLSNILSYRLLWRNGGANLSPQPTLQVCTPLRLAGGLFNFLFFTCKKKNNNVPLDTRQDTPPRCLKCRKNSREALCNAFVSK